MESELVHIRVRDRTVSDQAVMDMRARFSVCGAGELGDVGCLSL
jgi:hypothetical protein